MLEGQRRLQSRWAMESKRMLCSRPISYIGGTVVGSETCDSGGDVGGDEA